MSRSMIRAAMVAALALCCVPAVHAQSAYYETLRYRSDDVFVFCTQGRKENPRAWKPISPFTGGMAWIPLPPYCPVPSTGNCPVYPYTYRSWSQDDMASWQQYERVCPHGEQPGKWKAHNGQGKAENTPFSH